MTTKNQIIALIGLTIVLAFTFFISADFAKISLLETEKYYVGYYSDAEEGGNTQIEAKSEEIPHFHYSIGDGVEYPFAGSYLEDTLEGERIDLSQFDYVEIELSATKGQKIPFTFNALWNLQNRPYVVYVPASPKLQSTRFEISDFSTPDWWMTQYKVTQDSHQDFSEVVTVNIEDCHVLPAGTQDEIRVTKINLGTDNTSLLSLIIILWAVGGITIYLIPKFRPEKQLVPVKASQFKVKDEEDPNGKITSFIGEHYADPDLSVRKVAKGTGLKEIEVSKSIKLNYQKNFKEYLNFIRLTEAKRLLKESDLNVSEIAYTVGYNNVTHFNRVFKGVENISPNEFRDKE